MLRRPGSQLQAVVGADHVETVLIREGRTGRVVAREAAAVFVLLTGEPRSDWLADALARSRTGGVLTGEGARSSETLRWPLTRRPFRYETSLPGVFAVGEVRQEGAAGPDGVVESVRVVREVVAYLRGG